MKYYLIIESFGYYDDYQQTPLFLVKTEEKAKKTVDLYNECVSWKEEKRRQAREAEKKWEKKNPPPEHTSNVSRRIDQINTLLAENFTEELKKPLREEIKYLKEKLKACQNWQDQRKQVFHQALESHPIPSKFKQCQSLCGIGSFFEYKELEVKE